MKTIEKKKVKVLFLVHEINLPGLDEKWDDLFAFFPEESYFPEGWQYPQDEFGSYSHIGQHSSCHIDYANHSRKASQDEYADLLQELKSIGYECEVLN